MIQASKSLFPKKKKGNHGLDRASSVSLSGHVFARSLGSLVYELQNRSFHNSFSKKPE